MINNKIYNLATMIIIEKEMHIKTNYRKVEAPLEVVILTLSLEIIISMLILDILVQHLIHNNNKILHNKIKVSIK